MRCLFVLLPLLACRGTPPPMSSPAAVVIAPAVAPAPVVARTPSPPVLPTFTQPGTIYMPALAGDQPLCEAWTIDGEGKRLVNTRPYGTASITRTVAFTLDGSKLVPGEVTWRDDSDSDNWTASSCSASDALELREREDAIVLASGAKWFRTEEGCAQAIAEHARVVTEWCAPGYEPDRTLEPDEPTRQKFEKLLARGGTLYSIVDGPQGDTCKPIRVRTGSIYGTHDLEGTFTWRVVDDEGVKGTASAAYQLQRGETKMMMLDGGEQYENGVGGGRLCGRETSITYEPDVVVLADPMYFTKAACRAAIRTARVRESWMPLDPGEEVAELPRYEGAPNVGGC